MSTHLLNYQYNQALSTLKPLDTIPRRISIKQDSQRQAKLTNVFFNIKKKSIMRIFISKLKRNITSFQPCDLTGLYQQKDRDRIQGFNINRHFYNIILFIALIGLILTTVLSSFEAFILKYRELQVYKNVQVIVMKIILCVIFFIKIVVNSINKTFKAGVQKKYLTDIIINYMSNGSFFFDLIMLLLLIIFTAVDNIVPAIILFIYCFLMFIFTMNDLSHLQTNYVHSQRMNLYWDLLKIAIFNVIFAHFLCSLLFAMSYINREQSWLIGMAIDGELWNIQYFWAYYWATTIMMTVGFGDFLPNNYQEAYVVAFLQMISCIILAYNISEIGAIISKIRSINQETQRKLGLFQRMSQQIDNEGQNLLLKTRISNYLKESNYLKSHFQYQAMDQLLNQLPEHLRRNYIQVRNSKIFKDTSFFKNLKNQTITQLAFHFDRIFFYPGAYIGKNQSQQHIQILQNGTIGLGYKRKGSRLNGKIFQRIQRIEGQKTILLSKSFLSLYNKIQYYHIADSYAMIWQIKYDDFIKIISQSLIDYQHYWSIVHKHPYTNNEYQTIKCERCGSKQLAQYHSIFQCPRLHYMPINWVLISRHNVVQKSIRQKRHQYKRQGNKLKKLSALKSLKQYFKQAQDFRAKDKQLILHQDRQHKHERYEDQLQQKRLEHLQKLGQVSDERFKNLVNDAIRYYESGYQADNFWDINSDQLNDYNFYFPNQNPNRLLLTPTNYSAQQIYWKNKTKSKKQLLQEERILQ